MDPIGETLLGVFVPSVFCRCPQKFLGRRLFSILGGAEEFCLLLRGWKIGGADEGLSGR